MHKLQVSGDDGEIIPATCTLNSCALSQSIFIFTSFQEKLEAHLK